MEDDIRIFKMEYPSNHWLDLSKIVNLSLGDQTESKNCLTQLTNNNEKADKNDFKMNNKCKLDIMLHISGVVVHTCC